MGPRVRVLLCSLDSTNSCSHYAWIPGPRCAIVANAWYRTAGLFQSFLCQCPTLCFVITISFKQGGRPRVRPVAMLNSGIDGVGWSSRSLKGSGCLCTYRVPTLTCSCTYAYYVHKTIQTRAPPLDRCGRCSSATIIVSSNVPPQHLGSCRLLRESLSAGEAPWRQKSRNKLDCSGKSRGVDLHMLVRACYERRRV